MLGLTKQVNEALEREGLKVPIRVAVMGCVVNGPGEAREADLGIAAGKGQGFLVVKGEVIDKIPESEFVVAPGRGGQEDGRGRARRLRLSPIARFEPGAAAADTRDVKRVLALSAAAAAPSCFGGAADRGRRGRRAGHLVLGLPGQQRLEHGHPQAPDPLRRAGRGSGPSHAGSTRLHPDFGPPSYGIPFDVVPSSHAKVSIDFQYDDESDPGPYPFGGDVRIEGGSDRHAIMIDEGTCRLYELFARPAERRDTPAQGAGRSSTSVRTRSARPGGRAPTPPVCRSSRGSSATTRSSVRTRDPPRAALHGGLHAPELRVAGAPPGGGRGSGPALRWERGSGSAAAST